MTKSIALSFLLLSLFFNPLLAHPGSGIVTDSKGNVYFTDTGKGVWKIDQAGKLTFIESQRFHWMAIDEHGCFAGSPKSFRNSYGDFERVTVPGSNIFLLLSSDFPVTMHRNGNMYYANTRPGITSLIRLSPDGHEKVLAKNALFEYIDGICVAADGSLLATVGNKSADVSKIMKVTMDGKVSTIASYKGNVNGTNLPLETTPSYCRGIESGADGQIYVAATGSRQVLKVNPQGKITTLLENHDAWSPTSIAIHQDEIFVLEWHDVPAAELENRQAWIPRVKKIAKDGKESVLAVVSRSD